jgi:hypothetical protein
MFIQSVMFTNLEKLSGMIQLDMYGFIIFLDFSGSQLSSLGVLNSLLQQLLVYGISLKVVTQMIKQRPL